MRLLVTALAIGCSSNQATAPAWKDDDFVYAFAVAAYDPSPDVRYEYRLDGDCLGRGAVGEPFTPHKDRAGTARPIRVIPFLVEAPQQLETVWLAPKSDLAIGLVVGTEHRRCVRVQLDRTHTTLVML